MECFDFRRKGISVFFTPMQGQDKFVKNLPLSLLILFGRAYLFAKTLHRLNTTFDKPLKLEHSSPAPIRHSVKKKVENYDTGRKK
jgi:hypothetical protein